MLFTFTQLVVSALLEQDGIAETKKTLREVIDKTLSEKLEMLATRVKILHILKAMKKDYSLVSTSFVAALVRQNNGFNQDSEESELTVILQPGRIGPTPRPGKLAHSDSRWTNIHS